MNASPLRHLDPAAFAQLLQRLAATADDAVVVTDGTQRIVMFNEGAERIFGHAAARVLGQPLAMLLPEGSAEAHAHHLQRFATSRPAARRMGERGDVRGRRADGSLFDAEASISHIELGGDTFFTAIVRDVSARRAAERALAASEQRFRSLAAVAPVGIFQTDAHGACRFVNQRWCEMAGLDADAALGAGWVRAIHPGDRARVLELWRTAVAEGRPFGAEYRFLRDDGAETWVIGSAVASRDADGRIDGHVGTVTDVTESHRQAVALQQAKAEAERAADAKALFLANMSHEVRTPLNAVVGMTTLLMDTPLGDEQRDFVRTIQASAESLLEIVDDILDFSKAEAGRLEIDEQPFDLRRCVEDALDLMSPRAQDKRLNLAYLVEEGTPERLLGDGLRVRQVLVNLLSNAVKFTHRGEVFVAVDAEPLDGDRCRVRIAVRDTGIGIAEQHLPRLFQSFSQVDATTTRQYGGTGLGLAISRRLAELMGGTVEVSSTPGQGSVFTLSFVARAAPEPATGGFLQRRTPELAGRRLLIVDDNLTNRRILTKLALQWGVLPTPLPSALEALDLLRHGEPFDVALLDMCMPDMDGIDLAAEIARLEPARRLPLVLLTSVGHRLMPPGPTHRRFAATLAKPIKAGALYATLLDVLQGVPTAAPGAASMPDAPAPAPAVRVLVAEDNPGNQKVALRMLQRLGVRADLAANGLQVIEAVERRRYDVVLMDIQMPEMDGVQAARWIAERRGPDGGPRVVAMTANVMPGDRERYRAAGIEEIVVKPIDLERLAAALHVATPLLRPDDDVAAPGDGVLDGRRLAHLRALQDPQAPALLRELIGLYTRDVPGHLVQLAQSCADGDGPALRASAHRLLSITDNLGAQRMSRLCTALERHAMHATFDDAARLLAALRVEHALVVEALASEAARA